MPLFPLTFNTHKDTKLDSAAGTFDMKLLLTSRVVRAGNSICLLAYKTLKMNENYYSFSFLLRPSRRGINNMSGHFALPKI